MEAVHLAWPSIVDTSCTSMRPHRSAPLKVSNAAAAQVAAVLTLAAAREAHGMRLSGDGALYSRYNVLLLETTPASVAAASTSSQVGEDEALVGSITSCGGPEATVGVSPGRLETEAFVAQSTCRGEEGADTQSHNYVLIYHRQPYLKSY